MTSERQWTERNAIRRIEKPEEGSYVEIPFVMPERVEELYVSYRVESHGSGKAVIDLGVRDESRIRGWSGGARTEFRIGGEQATPGYMPGRLDPGEWAVVHNAYRVPDEGCTVHVTIRFEFRTSRWLKGDLHTHSVHSDGKYTLEENAAILEELGCDFIAMTDHNTVSQNAAYPRQTGIVMIPGMELTTNFGHSNFLGVSDPLDDFRAQNQAEVDARISTARERGAKIVLNHPHCDYCPWLWDFGVDHDWVEIWNGPWTERNARTLRWWQEQLAFGRRLVAVGGSDVHRPDPFVKHAMPCTWVLADSKTVEGILDGISKGHCFITYAPEGPFVELSCGAAMMGDLVLTGMPGHETVRLRIEDLMPGDQIKLIGDQGVVHQWNAESAKLEAHIDRGDHLFLRAEVWRYFEQVKQTLLAAVTNPIYFEK